MPVDPATRPGLRRGLAELEPGDLVPRRRADRPAARRGVAAHDALPPGHAASGRRAAGRGRARRRPRQRRAGPLLRRHRPGRRTRPSPRPSSTTGSSSGRRGRSSATHGRRRRDRPRGVRRRVRRTGPAATPAAPPTVWCSWYRYFEQVTADDVRENLRAFDDHDLAVDVVQVDDGWSPGLGEGLASADRFGSLRRAARRGARDRPPGRASGWRRSSSARDSTLATEHPDWLVGPAGRNWGDDLVGLDLTHPGVLDLLAATFTRLVDLGVDYLKLDFLYGGAVPGRRREDMTGVEAYRSGLSLIREVVGPEVYLVGCGAPLLPSVGLVDAMRVSPDTFHEGGEDGWPRPARADAAGRARLAAGSLLGQRPRLPGRPAVVRRRASGGRRGHRARRAGVVLRPRRRARRLGPGRACATCSAAAARATPLLARARSVAAARIGHGGAAVTRVTERARQRASRRTSSCSTPTSTRRSCRRLVAMADGVRRAAARAHASRRRRERTACLITYGDGIRRAGRDAAAHAVGLPARPRRRPGQRRAPAADVPLDLRRRLRGRRPPRGQPLPGHVGRTSPRWPASTT